MTPSNTSSDASSISSSPLDGFMMNLLNRCRRISSSSSLLPNNGILMEWDNDDDQENDHDMIVSVISDHAKLLATYQINEFDPPPIPDEARTPPSLPRRRPSVGSTSSTTPPPSSDHSYPSSSSQYDPLLSTSSCDSGILRSSSRFVPLQLRQIPTPPPQSVSRWHASSAVNPPPPPPTNRYPMLP